MEIFRRHSLDRDMFVNVVGSFLLLLLSSSWLCQATELMFELPDRDRQCFYEDIDKGVSSTLEYQVNTQIVFLIKAHQYLMTRANACIPRAYQGLIYS